jgi:hypothetical protein
MKGWRSMRHDRAVSRGPNRPAAGGLGQGHSRRAATVSWTALPSRAAGLGVLLLLSLASPTRAEDGRTYGLLLQGAEAEAFLRTARVVEREDLDEGVTRPQRLTLSDGQRTLRATWKTIHQHIPGMWRDERGGYQFDFRDSWKHEVAAYELDKLLGLGMVPPTVAREIEGRRGSLQLWVEGVMTEDDRKERGITPKGPRDTIRLFNQMHCVRLFHQLTYNTDFRNIENILVDPDFRIYVIDASRAFRIQHDLLAPDDLECFSRATLDRLEALDRPLVEKTMGELLDRRQVEGLLARRDKILTLVKVRLIKEGPGKILFQ